MQFQQFLPLPFRQKDYTTIEKSTNSSVGNTCKTRDRGKRREHQERDQISAGGATAGAGGARRTEGRSPNFLDSISQKLIQFFYFKLIQLKFPRKLGSGAQNHLVSRSVLSENSASYRFHDFLWFEDVTPRTNILEACSINQTGNLNMHQQKKSDVSSRKPICGSLNSCR